MRKCILPAFLTYLAGMGTMGAVVTWTRTETLTVQEALELLKDDLTPEQRLLVAAALRRQGLAAIRALRDLALAKDAAATEAVVGLEQLVEALRK